MLAALPELAPIKILPALFLLGGFSLVLEMVVSG